MAKSAKATSGRPLRWNTGTAGACAFAAGSALRDIPCFGIRPWLPFLLLRGADGAIALLPW
jgi:hypothetical protein